MPETNASPSQESPPYQFLPPPLEYEALKADIRARGIQVAVEFDESGNVLDGHTRLQIAGELGLTSFPRVVRAGLSEAEKQEHALALNLSRRHLTRDQRRQVVVTLRGRGWSSRRIAAVTGISAPTVLRDLRAAGVSDVTTDHPTQVQGADGKTYRARKKTSVVVSTDHQQRLAQEALHALGDEAPGRMTDLRRLERLRRDQRARLAREQSRARATQLPDGVDLHHCRFEDLDFTSGAAGAVITDPPYDRRAMEDGTWERLGAFCRRVLRPGGLLVTYTPTMWLPEPSMPC